jgi:hypothetical protein
MPENNLYLQFQNEHTPDRVRQPGFIQKAKQQSLTNRHKAPHDCKLDHLEKKITHIA